MGLSRGGHNLDFIIEKDSIGFGYEIKLAMKITAIAAQKCGTGKSVMIPWKETHLHLFHISIYSEKTYFLAFKCKLVYN